VLAQEVIACLHPQAGESYLDLTAGYGGHAEAILKATAAPGNFTLVDRDQTATEGLKKKFKTAHIIHQDFLGACTQLVGKQATFDMILADLGVSSPHFDRAERGFSFSQDGPLDMRMDQRQDLTAEDIVNHAPKQELADIIYRFGEEKASRRIAKTIAANRPIKTTGQLARVVASAANFSLKRRVHPATKTFQALRIAVNDELGQLEKALPLMVNLLAPGGRLAIISFHSLEDRIVKHFLAEHAHKGYDGELKLLTKKPLTAAQNEIVNNPRARSAKLRAAVKIKN